MSTEKPESCDPRPGKLYTTVAVLGVGLIGGSLALAFKRSGAVDRVIGVSRPETIGKALELGVIDEGFPREETAAALARADLVVMGAPVSVIVRQLGEIGPLLKSGATVTDVGSTKRAIVAAARESLPVGAHFVGGHPMAGAESTGVEEADPFLFQNAVYVITPAEEKDREAAERYCGLLQRIGARVVVMTPERHDRIAATISHLPQMLAVSLMNLAADLNEQDPNTLQLAAGGFRDLTRIASSSFDIWRDICATNPDQITSLIDLFIASLQELRAEVGKESLATRFERSARSRALIHRDSKGFINRVWQVIVTAPDEVGVILGIAKGLAESSINIKDIEVLKVREGEGGTIMLGFSGREERAEAIRVLRVLGFPCRERE